MCFKNCDVNVKSWVLASIATFVVMAVVDFVAHGIVMAGAYEATADVWRDPAESEALMGWMFASQFLGALVMTFIYSFGMKEGGVCEGARFGFYIGALGATIALGMYVYLPISLSLVGSWIIIDLIRGVLIGATIGLVYKK